MDEQGFFDFTSPAKPRLDGMQLWQPDQLFDTLDDELIRQIKEDRRVERKSSKVQARALGEYLSMWSNTQPHGGIILVGIANDGAVEGCRSLGVEGKNKLERLSPLCPDAHWASKEVPVLNRNGEPDFILAFRVKYRPDKLVETSGGLAFIREGDDKVQINEVMKRELRIAKGEIHYELEPCGLKYPDDFELNEINKFCKSFYDNRRLQTAKSREDLLCLAKLGKMNEGSFEPNMACALAFAHDPRDIVPGARIRVIRYEGTFEQFGREINAIFSQYIDGPIARLLFDAKPIIASQLRSFQKYDDSGKIARMPEYPEEAWFEAVVNAVAHRSYNLKTQNIFVKIFDDKFVVESPGGFVPPTTEATVYDAHNPRNPFLMEAMMHLELTFCGFEGTRRMREEMRKASLPDPHFKQVEQINHQVHVVLENNIEGRRSYTENRFNEYISEDDFLALSPDERSLLNYVMHATESNITTAALHLKKSWPTAQKAMLGLLERELVEEVSKRGKKGDSTKVYRLKERSRSVTGR